MAKGSDPNTSRDYDLEEAFPSAGHLFQVRPRSVEAIKDTCLVVLDTNVLLVPYLVGPHAIDQVSRTYKRLAGADRLFVPERVAREFVRLRAEKLKEVHHQITLRRDQHARPFPTGKYPLLTPLAEYNALLETERELVPKISEYRARVSALLDRITSWNWDDPVSQLYGNLFVDTRVAAPKQTHEQVRAELTRRFEQRIPPGYKDAAKPDSGVGDLAIWMTILALAEKHKADVLFVTGEEKADWWHRSAGQELYPRFELAEEFWRASGGQTFQIASVSQLFRLLGAEETVVAELRMGEAEIVSVDLPPSQLPNDLFDTLLRQESGELDPPVFRKAIRSWLKREIAADYDIKFPTKSEITFVDSDGDQIYVSHRWVSARTPFAKVRAELAEAALSATVAMNRGFTLGIAILMGPDHNLGTLYSAFNSADLTLRDGVRIYIVGWDGSRFRTYVERRGDIPD